MKKNGKDVTEGIRALKERAERWKSLDSRECLEHPYNEFCLVSDRITDRKVTVHDNCRITSEIELVGKSHKRRINRRTSYGKII